MVYPERFYLFAETGEAAGWVKNIRRNPGVTVRGGKLQIDATARVLERQTDRQLWDGVAAIANRKYGWGDGLPMEITPLALSCSHSDPSVKLGTNRGAERNMERARHLLVRSILKSKEINHARRCSIWPV